MFPKSEVKALPAYAGQNIRKANLAVAASAMGTPRSIPKMATILAASVSEAQKAAAIQDQGFRRTSIIGLVKLPHSISLFGRHSSNGRHVKLKSGTGFGSRLCVFPALIRAAVSRDLAFAKVGYARRRDRRRWPIGSSRRQNTTGSRRDPVDPMYLLVLHSVLQTSSRVASCNANT